MNNPNNIVLRLLILIPDNNIHFFTLPFEIINIIYTYFKNSKDMKTQLSIRGVCKEWYEQIPNVTNYINNKLINTFIFSPTKFKSVLNDGFINKQIVFAPYGCSKYIEYNDSKKIILIIIYNTNKIITYKVLRPYKTLIKTIDLSKNKYHDYTNYNTYTVENNSITKYNPFVNINMNINNINNINNMYHNFNHPGCTVS
jgi:hypothetical protein